MKDTRLSDESWVMKNTRLTASTQLTPPKYRRPVSMSVPRNPINELAASIVAMAEAARIVEERRTEYRFINWCNADKKGPRKFRGPNPYNHRVCPTFTIECDGMTSLVALLNDGWRPIVDGTLEALVQITPFTGKEEGDGSFVMKAIILKREPLSF